MENKKTEEVEEAIPVLGDAPVTALRRIPERQQTVLCDRCGAMRIGRDMVAGGVLPYCTWDYEGERWIVEQRRCHCPTGATKNKPLYDDGRWAHPADDAELCSLRELEVLSGRSRFEAWDEGRKFLKGRQAADYEPVRDPRGTEWFKSAPDPAWQNPDWKGDDGG